MRFKEFHNEYTILSLGQCLKIKSGKSQKNIECNNGKYKIYGTGGIIGFTNEYLYDKESVGIGRKGTINKPFYFNEPFWTVDTLFYSEIKENNVSKYIYYLFQTIPWKKYNTSTGVPSLTSSSIEAIEKGFPLKEEQYKIATFLSFIDKRIQTQIKIIDDLKLQKKIISEEIFKSINRKPNGIIRNFINYEQPTKYIVKSTDYVDKNINSIPVLTANQAFILGYTNDTEGIYDFGECIIFDDFTMDLKYVDFPFKVKSSAIKILTSKNNVNIKYIYEYLKHLNLSSQEHKRHYISEVEVLDVFIPTIEIQNNKLQIINTFNEKLENEKAILNSYIKEKNYLLSNLFI